MVTRKEFVSNYRQVLASRDAIEVDLQGRLSKVFAEQGRTVARHLATIRSGVVLDVPIGKGHQFGPRREEFVSGNTAGHRKVQDPAHIVGVPPVLAVSANEVFMDGFDDRLHAGVDDAIRTHVAVIGGLLIGAAAFGTKAALNARADRLVDDLTERIGYVGENTQAAVQTVLAADAADGADFDTMSGHLSDLFDRLAGRASAAVARDETTAILSGTLTAASQVADIPRTQRMWVTQRDERVRPDHDDADGQVVDLDQPFSVGDEELDFPGDPNGSPAQTANCRCFIILVPGGTEGDDAVTIDESGDEIDAESVMASATFGSEDQPRDENGRFAGSGGDTKTEDKPSVAKSSAVPPGGLGRVKIGSSRISDALTKHAHAIRERNERSRIDRSKLKGWHPSDQPEMQHAIYAASSETFGEDQPRDDRGRFEGGGGNSSGPSGSREPSGKTAGRDSTVVESAKSHDDRVSGHVTTHLGERPKSYPAGGGRRMGDSPTSDALHQQTEAIRIRNESLRESPSYVRRKAASVEALTSFAAGDPQALIDWFDAGADGQIDWGQPGDFEQCVEVASDHMSEDDAKGFCNERHQDAVGGPPGSEH